MLLLNEDLSISNNLEEINFRNLVIFYSKELRMIQKGIEANKVLNLRELGKLKENGVISYGKFSSEAWITKRTLKVLRNCENHANSHVNSISRACER